MADVRTAPCLLIVVFALVGCAARGPSRQLAADTARADALLRDGCYRCLEEALAVHERRIMDRRASVAAIERAFDAALLLALREKELGLPSDASMQRARVLADRLRTAAPAVVGVEALLAAAEQVAGELSGFDPEERHRRTRLTAASSPVDAPERTALEPLLDTSIVAAYIALAMDCEAGPRRRSIDAADALARFAGPPLMQYRAATCQLPGAPPLQAIRERDPRWVETMYFEGRREVQSSAGDPERGVALLTGARDAFPGSHAIVLALARAQRVSGDYAGALTSVDAVLAEVPTHRDALLARVENLGALQRHDEAVTAASRMIELGTWHIGDAYYWRAWNELYLRRLDQAWDDVERAATLQSNSSVYTLAGFIAHARKELEVAIDRFDRAFAMDRRNCLASFSGGMVEVERQQWPTASTRFSRGMDCYTADAAEARAELLRIEASDHSPHRKARLTATGRKRIDSSEHLAAQSAFNAAQCYLRLGQREPALSHVEVAAADVVLRDKAAALRAAIEKMR